VLYRGAIRWCTVLNLAVSVVTNFSKPNKYVEIVTNMRE